MYVKGNNIIVTKDDIEEACMYNEPHKYLGSKLAEISSALYYNEYERRASFDRVDYKFRVNYKIIFKFDEKEVGNDE